VEDAWWAVDVAVGEASDGGVEADGDGLMFDLADGVGAVLEVAGADVAVDAVPVVDARVL